MDMVERVARALAAEMEAGLPRFTQQSWDQLSIPARAKFIQRARVAIEAMREPTEAMVAAGTAADWVGEVESRAGLSILPDETPDWARDDDNAVIKRPGIWHAMIDAALDS